MSDRVIVSFIALCCAGCHSSADARFPEKLKAIEYFESNRSDLDAIADRILDNETISGVTCYVDGQVLLRLNDGGPDRQMENVHNRELSELCTRAQLGLVWETGTGVYVDGGFVIEGESRFNAGFFRGLQLDSVQADCAVIAELGQVGSCRFHLVDDWYLQYEWHPVEIDEADAN